MSALGSWVKRWRTALHIAASAALIAVPGLALAPAVHAAEVGARLAVTSTWQTGFIGRFTIVNASAVPMNDWRLEFDMPAGQSVLRTWSSTLTQYGTHYVITPSNWNRIIPPGGTANGGMRGILSGTYTPPLNCVLNGQIPCS